MGTGFYRAVRESFRYRWSLLASLVNALLIGLLWGLSITTVYPFVEIVMRGETVQTWFDSQAQKSTEASIQSREKVLDLQRQIAQAAGGQTVSLERELFVARSRHAANEKTLAAIRYFQPLAHAYLPKSAFNTLVLVMAWLLVSILIKSVCLVSETMLVCRVAGRTVADMRRTFYCAALEMDQKTLDAHGTTAVAAQIVHNTNLVRMGLETLYGASVREPLKILACLVGAALISWQLVLISLVLAPLGAVLIRGLAKRTKQASMSQCRGTATVLETIIETLNGIKLVKAYNRERVERHRFKTEVLDLYRGGMKIAFYDALVKPVTELTGIITISLAILIGAHLVLNQQTHLWGLPICAEPLSVGALCLFYAMLAGIAGPARKLGEIYSTLARASAACHGLYATFEAKPGIAAPLHASPVPMHCRSIRFQDVRFAYKDDHVVLDNVSFEIPFGQTVALVGRNGCGKTTILNLLARFYDPQQGSILIDDVDIRDVSPKRLRTHMAIVTQDPILFQGTVWENIAYGGSTDRDRILAAARLARVDDFIANLANGYQTPVGARGNSLSGGQRQRVALARAILVDPRILILDEATSQIDQQNEELVQDTLHSFLSGRTTILVTHRPSTIRLAQRVLMMDQGRIIEDLTSDEYLTRFAPDELLRIKVA
ncbi:MAG: ABC transporter ATP-binding protein [Planctomycetes bacterium]|nr:ABC transporter ATP-binding protein [Planctomycetota bacterium]